MCRHMVVLVVAGVIHDIGDNVTMIERKAGVERDGPIRVVSLPVVRVDVH